MKKPLGIVIIGVLALLAIWPAAAQTIGYADAMRILNKSCGKDIKKLCPKVRLGSGRIEDCLARNTAKVSQACKSDYVAVYAHLEKRFAAQQSAAKICDPDIRRLCQGVRKAKGYVLRCLLGKRNLRKACSQVITDAGWR